MNNPFEVTPKKRSVKIKKSGVIYNNPNGVKKGLFYLGTGAIIIAIIYLIYLYQPLTYSWFIYETKLKSQKEAVIEKVATEKPPVVENNEFSIRIPRIGAESKVVAGVSPYNQDEYLKVLDDNLIAQSKTSSIPGDGNGKMIYLFAHSTQQNLQMVRKNSVFYLLGELNNNDVVYINYKGKLYTYKVYMKTIVGSKEVDYLNYSEKDKEILILQTCWPLGTNWQRLLVFAERV